MAILYHLSSKNKHKLKINIYTSVIKDKLVIEGEKQLENKIHCCITNIDEILDQYTKEITQNHENSRAIIKNLRNNLAQTKKLFIDNINAQKEILSDEDPRTLMFSLQSRRSKTAALGTFIADQIIKSISPRRTRRFFIGLHIVWRLPTGGGVLETAFCCSSRPSWFNCRFKQIAIHDNFLINQKDCGALLGNTLIFTMQSA